MGCLSLYCIVRRHKMLYITTVTLVSAVLCSCSVVEESGKDKRSILPAYLNLRTPLKTVYGSGYKRNTGYGFTSGDETPVYVGYIGEAPVYRNLGYDFNRDQHAVHPSYLEDDRDYGDDHVNSIGLPGPLPFPAEGRLPFAGPGLPLLGGGLPLPGPVLPVPLGPLPPLLPLH